MEKQDVKYLTLVKSGADGAYTLAESGYSFVRDAAFRFSPQVVKDAVSSTESRLSPVLQSYLHLSQSLLVLADTVVDAGFTLSTDAVSQTKKAAATTYNYTVVSPLKSASESIDKAVSKFTNDPEGVVPAARKKVAEAWDGAATVPSKMYAGTLEAVESLRDRLQKSVNTGFVQDLTATAQSRYTTAHDALVKNPHYAQLYDKTQRYVKWIVSLPVIKTPAEYAYSIAYPRLQNYVDPVTSKVEPYLKAIEEHIEPKVGESPMAVSETSTMESS